ncbi:unnamed protein product [Bursaphelenchus okinawaensis]|uniref:Uncharacterized protein n=1 Tax=Bursaphelenchus okinawaensis TaxID=465554 RepID=A0A811LR09_9BILA|nr:unnamed protein product [Bursaphelenchus okinawaensis]CAG9127005.1 unnamed protein product [Bursaphelenchus okinawaensis]
MVKCTFFFLLMFVVVNIGESEDVYTLSTNDGVLSLPRQPYYQYLLRMKTNGRFQKRSLGIYPIFDEWRELMKDKVDEAKEALATCIQQTSDAIVKECTYVGKHWPCLKGTFYNNDTGLVEHFYNVTQLALLDCTTRHGSENEIKDYCCASKDRCYRQCYNP